MRPMVALALLLVFLLAIPVKSSAQSELVTPNILQRVFLIKCGDQLGSSFTIDLDNRQYLVSAKHLLDGLKESDQIQIFHDSQWQTLQVKRIDLKNPKVDILVLAPSVQLSPPLDLQPSTSNILLSQNVFFLGFPFGMMEEAKGLTFPLPFVKKGIVSSFDFDDQDGSILWVDGFNDPGFSGGPIVYFDSKEKKLKVAAVVSGYRTQMTAIYKQEKALAIKAATNSGLLIAYTIDAAVEAIKAKPIGFELKTK